MRLKIDQTTGELYAGQWAFSYCLDYHLFITFKGDYLQVKMHDVTRDEECALELISSSKFYISFWMSSSWCTCKVKIYPKLDNLIGVEFYDADLYNKVQRKVKIKKEPSYIILEDDSHLKDYFGLWTSENNFNYILVNPQEKGTAISIYSNVSHSWNDILLESYRIKKVYNATADSICFTVKGYSENKTQDLQLFFHKNRVVLSYSQMLKVSAL